MSAVQSRPCPPAFSSSWATVLFLSGRDCAQNVPESSAFQRIRAHILPCPMPSKELLKARLTLQIYRLIKARDLTQAQAGKILGIKQPHVSAR